MINYLNLNIYYPVTTWRKNLADLSTTSSQTCDTLFSSNKVASGRDWSASNDSVSNSLQISISSPERQARRKYAKEKFKAAREPTRASPSDAFSLDLTLKQKEIKIYPHIFLNRFVK